MSSAPDFWPLMPNVDVGNTPVPMFPLPGVFFFPGQLLPLHVFEPRYRQMIEDSLDGPGRLVIATVEERHRNALSGKPDVIPVAGLGEIARHERTDDGRFLIWLCGLCRVRIEEVESDRLYRRVRVMPLAEIGATTHEDREMRERLVAQIERCAGSKMPPSAEVPLGNLADVLAQVLCLPEAVMAAIHGETDMAERARRALAAADRFPPRKPG
ncbi:MAG: LON peptidase substrate-binding domain-containing protein [Planctomycetota bacterium]